jgi:hypothetical protein
LTYFCFTVTLSSDLSHQNQKMLQVFGSGGHGRAAAEAALLQGQWGQVIALSHNLPTHSSVLLPVVDLVDLQVPIQTDATLYVAIGSNTARETEAQSVGFERLASIVHPRTSVRAFSIMGAGFFVAAGAVVTHHARPGNGAIVNHGAAIDHVTETGDFSHIARNASVVGDAKLGQRLLIGSGAVGLPSVVMGDDVVQSLG